MPTAPQANACGRASIGLWACLLVACAPARADEPVLPANKALAKAAPANAFAAPVLKKAKAPSSRPEPVSAPAASAPAAASGSSSPIIGVDHYPVPKPPFTKGIFPCSECHTKGEMPNMKRRVIDEHKSIVLHHGPRERWCFDCHNPTDRDKLRLVSGTLVPFTESYRLCGQCHGPKLRDWRVGVHGKRTGYWNGRKRYLLCAHCHNPHAPRFKPLEPMPPPMRPAALR